MKLLFSVALLGLAWFALINIIASAAAWVAGRSLMTRSAPTPGALLAVRLLPAAVAAATVGDLERADTHAETARRSARMVRRPAWDAALVEVEPWDGNIDHLSEAFASGQVPGAAEPVPAE